jgi:hypothetical protein
VEGEPEHVWGVVTEPKETLGVALRKPSNFAKLSPMEVPAEETGPERTMSIAIVARRIPPPRIKMYSTAV